MATKALPPHSSEDVPIYQTVIKFIGCIAVVAVVGILVLAGLDKNVPDVMVAVASTALGGLVGILAPSPAK